MNAVVTGVAVDTSILSCLEVARDEILSRCKLACTSKRTSAATELFSYSWHRSSCRCWRSAYQKTRLRSQGSLTGRSLGFCRVFRRNNQDEIRCVIITCVTVAMSHSAGQVPVSMLVSTMFRKQEMVCSRSTPAIMVVVQTLAANVIERCNLGERQNYHLMHDYL